MPRSWLCRIQQALLAGALGLACTRSPLAAPPSRAAATVDIIDVGHGDAILISSAAGKRMLIDGGKPEAAPAVLAVLRSRSLCPLDLILLTHRHADHLGGLRRVIEECGARLFMDSGFRHDSELYERLLATLEKHGVALRQAEAGRQIDLGSGAVLTLLGPPQPPLTAPDAANANSVVARLTVGKSSVLLVGDADFAEEHWLLGRGVDLRSTVLKLGHHGSRTSSSESLLRAVAPRLAVVSNKPDDASHPHPETDARLHDSGARILETAKEGTIRLELDPEAVTFQTAKHPQETRLP